VYLAHDTVLDRDVAFALIKTEGLDDTAKTRITREAQAELLLDHYPAERAEAIKHLDFAIGELRDMKMQPSLERALKRKEILKA